MDNFGEDSGALQVQETVVGREDALMRHAEKEYQRAELAYHKAREEMQHLQKEGTKLQAEKAAIAEYRSQVAEKGAAKRVERQAKKQAREQESQRAKFEATAAKQQSATLQNMKTANSRVSQTAAVRNQAASLVEQKKQDAYTARVNSILELKDNSDASMEKLKAQLEKKQKKEKKKAEEQKQQFDGILKRGGNPYETFRKAELDQQAQDYKQAQLDRQHQEANRIAQAMVREDQDFAKKDIVVKKNEEFMRQYQKEVC
jgi:hypothetical protein